MMDRERSDFFRTLCFKVR